MLSGHLVSGFAAVSPDHHFFVFLKGIMRCAAYSAAVNRPLYVPSDEPQVQESAIQHFHEKLVLIRDRLKTAPGKALGEKRHSVLISFIASVEEEYDNSILDQASD